MAEFQAALKLLAMGAERLPLGLPHLQLAQFLPRLCFSRFQRL